MQVLFTYTVFHLKKTWYLNAHNIGKMLTDFQKIFNLGLSRDYVMNGSLKISSHLKGVDTLPCEM